MSEIEHRTVETNGIRMHIAEQGAGPLIVLCHGFPESWYSWRHQLRALADAGFHAVAPDMRGYGQTDRPEAIDQYTLLHLVGDMVGLLDSLGEDSAVIAGHDWGAPVAWHAALLRPDRFRAVVGLSVPYRPRGAGPSDLRHAPGPTTRSSTSSTSRSRAWPKRSSSATSASRTAASCTRPPGTLLAARRPFSNTDAVGMVPRRGGFLSAIVEPSTLPSWLTEADLDFYAQEFARTGFRGGLNWYRNIDRNWELLAPFAGARVTVPALYVAGDRDLVVAFRGMDQLLPNLSKFVPQLRRTLMLPGCGHWTQQERPQEVNTAMVDFLRSL